MKVWKEKHRLLSVMLTGFVYGILLNAFGAAAIGFWGTCISPWHTQHPLDQVAYGIIMAVSAIAFFVILFLDTGDTFSFKRAMIRLCAAAATVLILFVPIYMLMEFCEGVLDRLVS